MEAARGTLAPPAIVAALRALAFVTLVLAIGPRGASAQGARPGEVVSSPYLPLDDPAYELIDALQARGGLASLSLLERPYSLHALTDAIRTDSLAAGFQKLRSELSALLRDREPSPADSSQALRVRLDAELFATAQRSGLRELMLGDTARGAYPGAAARAFVQGGSLVAAARVILDERLKHDPEFEGKKDKKLSGRTEDAYVAGQWRFAEVFFGRLGRNWGPPALDGLLLGHYAYTYDHVAVTLGVPTLHLTTIAARLDDRVVSPDTVAQRYFSIHRLSGRWRDLEVALSEAIIYGGKGRGFEPKWLNPVNGFYLSQLNESPNIHGSVGSDGNMSYGLEIAYRQTPFGVLRGEFQLDDVAVNRCDSLCKKPPSYGVTLTADGIPIPAGSRFGDAVGFASYTRVTNLTYRNGSSFEQYMFENVGLGRGFSDYDEARLGVNVVAGSRFPLKFYGAFRRQGEGDYRIPQPPTSKFPETPTFLSGVVERISRIAVSGGGRIGSVVDLAGDVGLNRVRNAAHVSGAESRGIEGRLKLSLRLPWEFSRAIEQ